jgi:hypothetical protein
MEILRTIARGYILFVCVAYLFGQLFFGDFSFDTTIVAMTGITVAVLWSVANKNSSRKQKIICASAFIALTGCAYETYYYYTYLNSPGNDFAWAMRAPFYVLLIFILLSSWLHLARRGRRDGLQPPLH